MALLDDKTKILLKLFIPQRRKPNPKHAIPDADKNLSEKTVVFTGGTDGIGRSAVVSLCEMGAHVVLLGRNRTKGEEVANQVTSAGATGSVTVMDCDLASMDSVKNCAKRILAECKRIDVLVNCAGVTATGPQAVTIDGFENTWAINYFSAVLLTNLLLPRIQESTPARIVNLTTDTNFLETLDVDRIEATKNFSTHEPYTQSKLSFNMYSIDLAKRLEGSGVTVNYLMPGYIKSNLLRDLEGAEGAMRFFMNVMASPAEVGADRIVRLAISSEFEDVTGTYLWEDDIRPPHTEAQFDAKREHIARLTESALSRWL